MIIIDTKFNTIQIEKIIFAAILYSYVIKKIAITINDNICEK